MSVLIVGAGLVGSQIARILVEQGERPVLMDRAPSSRCIWPGFSTSSTFVPPTARRRFPT